MARKKANVLKDLQSFLVDLALEVRELRGEVKKLKTRMEKVFPARRGRPPKIVMGVGAASGAGRKGTKAGKKTAAKRGRPKKSAAKTAGKSAPGRRKKASVKKGPGPKG